MSSKLSVEEVLSNLEAREAFHREQEALHEQQEIHHREQRTLHAAELEKVQQSLEAFRTVAASAVDLARPLAPKPAPAPAAPKEPLPPAGRLMVSRLVRQIAESASFAEPFGAAVVAAEANRRLAGRLPKPGRPVGVRTASDVLRRMLTEGAIVLAREGTPHHEALYTRKSKSQG